MPPAVPRYTIPLLLLFCLGAVIVPLIQLGSTKLSTGGTSISIIAYTNALDEASYLQYDFSKRGTQGMFRPSQTVVTALHEQGLSGGWINFVFDLLLPSLTIALLLISAKVHGQRLTEAAWYLALGFFTIHLVNTSNPLISEMFSAISNSRLISAITLPASSFSPFYRTPEPQASYFILAIASMFAARFRNPLPFVVVVPLLYSFIALPVVFVAVGSVLLKFAEQRKLSRGVMLTLWFFAICLLLKIYYERFAPQLAKQFSIGSHWPLVSVTGIATIILYIRERAHLPESLRTPSLLMAATPWVCANHQIVSGHISQPSNFETYAGTLCVAYFLVLWATRSNLARKVLVTGGVCFWLLGATEYIQRQHGFTFPAELATTHLPALHQNPAALLINDPLLATMIDMAIPRQSPSGFSVNNVLKGVTDKNLEHYACARRTALNSEHGKEFLETVAYLDNAYRYETADSRLLNLHRREVSPLMHDPLSIVSECDFAQFTTVTLP